MWIIIIITAVVIFLVYNSYKGNQDIKNVEKSGGIENKYSELISFLMSNEKLRLSRKNSNNVEIGYSFIGDGFVRFHLTEMNKDLMVRYESKDMVDGIQKLAWKFNENLSQKDMFDKISEDLAIHNLRLSGLSKEEAYEELNSMKEEFSKNKS